eukprot:360381-Chlamydomonas_euryale.AAC.6
MGGFAPLRERSRSWLASRLRPADVRPSQRSMPSAPAPANGADDATCTAGFSAAGPEYAGYTSTRRSLAPARPAWLCASHSHTVGASDAACTLSYSAPAPLAGMWRLTRWMSAVWNDAQPSCAGRDPEATCAGVAWASRAG